MKHSNTPNANHNIKSRCYKNIDRLYPNSIIKGIKQFNDGNNWIDAPNILNNKFNDFNTVLNHLKINGVKSIQLIILNEYNILVYPDYNLNELI